MKNKLLIIFGVLIVLSSYGQTKFENYALNLKLGMYQEFVKSESGYCIGVDYDMLWKKDVFTIGYNAGSVPKYFSDGDNNIKQLYFLYGRFIDINNGFFRFQYQMGLAPTFGVIRGDLLYSEPGIAGISHYKEIPFFTLGVPVKLGFTIVPHSLLSVGVDLMVNFNNKKSVIMPMLSIKILGSRKKRVN